MQITETISEPLHREFTVVVGATDLDAKLTGKLAEMQPKIHLKGFRPGKAPVSFLKKTYGKSLMGEIVNETINESSEQLLKDLPFGSELGTVRGHDYQVVTDHCRMANLIQVDEREL